MLVYLIEKHIAINKGFFYNSVMQRMFLFLLFIVIFPLQILAGVGNIDDRYYVTDDMWATEPYKKYLHFEYDNPKLGHGNCTAQYVSPNLILTAGHCFDKDANNFRVTNYNKQTFEIKLIETPFDNNNIGEIGDWSVWLVTEPEYYSDAYFDIIVPTKTVDAINAGWGRIRIIKDEEMPIIRKVLANAKDPINWRQIYEELKNNNIEKLEDYSRLKASKCKIVFEDCSKISKINKIFGTKKSEEKLKNICNNQQSLKHEKNYPYILATTCDTWEGNSGGAYISESGENLYGVSSFGKNKGKGEFVDKYNAEYITSALQFDKRVKELIKIYDSKNSVEENIAELSKHTSDNKQNQNNKEHVIKELTKETEDLDKKLTVALSDVQNMTDDQLLGFIDNFVEYDVKKERLENLKQTYEDAKANEQSLANRTLTAASIAATGIGGMELAMGLAEQKADKEAEQDMSAYIASFRCEYGDGKQVKAGPEEIVLPGGNDEKLMSLRTKYMTLATDLKERKTALGMKPGIESEEILDKTAMNLYDDENTGIESGAYGSLYRAKMLNSEEDQAKLDEEAKKSKNRVIAGATVAGAGIVGGIAGNMAINGTDGKKNLNKIQEARTTENGMSPIPAKRDKCARACELTNETKKTKHLKRFNCPGCDE